nr:MAG TPA: hypothetical protein [Caudoviricetes sp.]
METKNEATFGERMSVEEFLKSQEAKSLEVFPRADKPGYFYFATEKGLGYVPQELGKKLENGEKTGRLFITAVQTEGYEEPMFMLCETKRESLLTITVD